MRGQHEVRSAEPNSNNSNTNQKLNLNLNSMLGYNSTSSTAVTSAINSARNFRANEMIDGNQCEEEVSVLVENDAGQSLRRQTSECQSYTPHVYNRLSNTNNNSNNNTICKSMQCDS